tara:strand:+ start:1599 stop:2717 length:1119 start_codon:yes stop_codon:yes gene_type:complete
MPRCPNGTRRNKKTGKCERKSTSKKCPEGKRLNPKTNRCIKIKLSNVKKCPKGKILNPKTKRCILDNSQNRKRLGLSNIKTKKQSINTINTTRCKKYPNIVPVELDRVKHLGGLLFSYNDAILDRQKYISEGTYGKVYSIYNNRYKIAVKTYKNKNDEEIGIIQYLNRKKVPCDTINARVIVEKGYIQNNTISIMDYMSGPLTLMNRKLLPVNIFKVVRDVAIHFDCLNRQKLSYTDIKGDNILFKCIDKEQLKIVLGDLGGICKRGDTHISTYPPYESRFDRGVVKCNEKTMVWGVGIIALELIGYNIGEFSWSVFGELSQNDIDYFINIYTNPSKYTNKKIHSQHEELLKKMLKLNPQKRCDLKTIIKSI